MSSAAGLRGLAPYERRPGRRGPRGVVAALAALGALPVLYLSRLPAGGTDGGSGGFRGYSYSYTLGPGPGTGLEMAAMAALLLAAAAVLWRAHAREAIVAGTALVAAAAVGSVLIVRAAEAAPSAAAINRVALGTPRGEVVRRLGDAQAVTEAVPNGALRVLPCLVYRVAGGIQPGLRQPSDPSSIAPGDQAAVLCFADGRLSLRVGA